MVEFAKLWLPILGAGICIAWAIGAWYGGDKRLAVWLTFLGVTSLLLLGAFQFDDYVTKGDASAPATPIPPYLFVQTDQVNILPGINATLTPGVTFRVVNTSPQTVIIDMMLTELRLSKIPRAPIVGKDQFDIRQSCPNVLGPHPLPPNYVLSSECKRVDTVSSDETERIQRKEMQAYFFGRILYHDLAGGQWEKGFTLIFVPPSAGGGPRGSFSPVLDQGANFDRRIEPQAQKQ